MVSATQIQTFTDAKLSIRSNYYPEGLPEHHTRSLTKLQDFACNNDDDEDFWSDISLDRNS